MICASSTSSAPSSDAQYWVNFPECEREHKYKYTLLGTWAVHQTLSACTKTLAVEVVMALLSRGSREAGLKLEEWKEKKRSRNLRRDAIKKPVLNYRSPLPQRTWVNPWFQKVWTIGSASMIYRSNIIYYLLNMFPTGCSEILGEKNLILEDEEGVLHSRRKNSRRYSKIQWCSAPSMKLYSADTLEIGFYLMQAAHIILPCPTHWCFTW